MMVGLLAVIIYSATFALAITLLQAKDSSNTTLIIAILVFGLAFLVNPLLAFGGRWVSKQIYRQGYDPQASVREYSSSISNLVNLEVLSKVALVMIGKTLDVERRNLLMVDEEEGEDQKGYYRLWAISEGQEEVLRSPAIQVNSPVGVYFQKDRRPLLQYDFDFLPQFHGTPPAVMEWFSHLEADLYVPIYSKGKWLGLFVLGPKSSGDRYFPEDLVLLSMLADQTSVSLENARLFENLKELNQNFVQAQKTLEEANQQLREIDELKSNFISVITHELRTPIANVSFSLQLIEMYGLENLLPEQQEQIVQLASGVKQAKIMVDNLITLATFLNKRVELSLEPLEFKEVIQESLTPLINKAKEKGVLLHLEIVGDLLPVVADHKHLVNAISQLVDNAIKFTGADGKVWVDSWTTSENAFLNVRDTGRGVPQNELPLIWSGFTQLADPLRRGLEGLGLGLALVKYIIAAHEGKVWAESLEGTGSAFGFQIPLEGPKATAEIKYDFQKLDDAPRPQVVL
jgi:signal transduction histidine kinase